MLDLKRFFPWTCWVSKETFSLFQIDIERLPSPFPSHCWNYTREASKQYNVYSEDYPVSYSLTVRFPSLIWFALIIYLLNHDVDMFDYWSCWWVRRNVIMTFIFVTWMYDCNIHFCQRVWLISTAIQSWYISFRGVTNLATRVTWWGSVDVMTHRYHMRALQSETEWQIQQPYYTPVALMLKVM